MRQNTRRVFALGATVLSCALLFAGPAAPVPGSQGLREFVVVMKHAVRNAMLPVVTIIGLNFGGLVSGAVLTETIFGLTGVGRTLVDGITARDYTLVQGFTIVIAVAFVMINLVVDLLYGYLDPRIRLS